MADRSAVSYTIRQLCQEFGCTPRALRFYEDKGLLSPERQGLNRLYSYRDRARLQLILRGKRLRLSLDEIRQILDLYKEDGGTRAQDAVTLRKYRERIVALEAQRLDIDTAIAELKAGCDIIEKRLAASE
jgi:DNA-binding transcriptional MerR regulator